MKDTKQAKALDDAAPLIIFPKEDSLFSSYKSSLRDLVADNFGYSTRESFEYEETDQKFYFKVESTGSVLRVGKTRVRFEVNIEIDPKLPLAPQFDTAHAQIAALEEHSVFVHKALFEAASKGEIKDAVRS